MTVSISKPGQFVEPDQIKEVLDLLREQAKIPMALIGGVALKWFGCPRIPGNVDVGALFEVNLSPLSSSPLRYGGTQWEREGEPPVRVLVRKDEYAMLFQNAIMSAIPGPEGFPTVTPEYLAAMKFIVPPREFEMDSVVHRLDLKWLLGRPGLVSREKLWQIVYDQVGGRFAKDMLRVLDGEVQLDIEMDPNRDRSSYP